MLKTEINMQTFSSSSTPSTQTSNTWFEMAQKYIPGGVNSPVRAFKAVDSTPRFIQKGQGAYLWDADNQQYIDYVGAFGPALLGHNHAAVIEAIINACQNGLSFGSPTSLEVELAQHICQHMPNIEQIRMVNSGTEATMSALRLARAVTGRSKMIKFAGCYHGHADCLLVEAGSGAMTYGQPSSPGINDSVAKDTLIARYNDLDSVCLLFEQYPHDIAALIVEPIAGNMNLVRPNPDFLPGLRALCDQYRALLIFDEVMTGFRVDIHGAQGLFNIKPDLTTLGKVIGGGLPIGAFGGHSQWMQQLSPQGPVYQAGTLSGNPIVMAAGLATLRQLKPSDYQQLSQVTQQLSEGLQARAHTYKLPFLTQHCTGMLGFFFTEQEVIQYYEEVKLCHEPLFKQFFRMMLDQGIYLAPSRFEANFVSLAHTGKEIETTLETAERAFWQLSKQN